MSHPSAKAGFVFFALAAGRANAQIAFSFSSLEWRVAASDLVVKAKVADYRELDPGTRSDTNSMRPVAVTLQVEEVLKGKAPRNIEVVAQFSWLDTGLKDWKSEGRQAVWFLKRAPHERAAPETWAPFAGEYAWEESSLPLGGREKDKVPYPPLSMDLSVLTTGDEVLGAARAAAHPDPSKARSFQFEISRDVAQRTGRSGDGNRLTVPVNPRLESLAREWLRSKEGPSSWAWRRDAAIGALSFFRSEENIALLEGLLESDEWRIEDHPTDSPRRTEKVFYLREHAYGVLQSWKVDVPKPLLRTPWPVPPTDPVPGPS